MARPAAAKTASVKENLVVFAGMVLSIWLAWTIRARVLETPSQPHDGPLSPFVVAEAAVPECAPTACKLALSHPQPGQVIRVQTVQVDLPEVDIIAAAPGNALVPLSPPLLYAVNLHGPRLPFVETTWPAVGADPGAGRLDGLDPAVLGLETSEPGWVRAGRDRQTGALIDFQGSGTLPEGAPRAYAELWFQRVPSVAWLLTLTERWPTSPVQGDAVRLHFRAPTPNEDTLPAADLPLEAWVSSHSPRVDGPDRMTLSMDMGEAHRMRERRFGNPAVPDPLPRRLWLEWKDHTADGRGAPWRVPVSALQQDAAGLRLWVALGGRAVPVVVTELQRIGAHSVVYEQPGKRGFAVRPEDWRALGSQARRVTYRALSVFPHRLLHAGARLLVRPPASLQPGTPLGNP